MDSQSKARISYKRKQALIDYIEEIFKKLKK